MNWTGRYGSTVYVYLKNDGSGKRMLPFVALHAHVMISLVLYQSHSIPSTELTCDVPIFSRMPPNDERPVIEEVDGLLFIKDYFRHSVA
jgi:hypothetical protein